MSAPDLFLGTNWQPQPGDRMHVEEYGRYCEYVRELIERGESWPLDFATWRVLVARRAAGQPA